MVKQIFDERGYYTKRNLTREICEVICENHNLSKDQVLINWLTKWKIVKYPTGLVQKVGFIRIHGKGFQVKNFTVHQVAHDSWHMN